MIALLAGAGIVLGVALLAAGVWLEARERGQRDTRSPGSG